jgi:hypothetical protein
MIGAYFSSGRFVCLLGHAGSAFLLGLLFIDRISSYVDPDIAQPPLPSLTSVSSLGLYHFLLFRFPTIRIPAHGCRSYSRVMAVPHFGHF